jgi:hypothetical protein
MVRSAITHAASGTGHDPQLYLCDAVGETRLSHRRRLGTSFWGWPINSRPMRLDAVRWKSKSWPDIGCGIPCCRWAVDQLDPAKTGEGN